MKVDLQMAPKKSTLRIITLGGTGKGKGKYISASTRRINFNIAPKHDDSFTDKLCEGSPAVPLCTKNDMEEQIMDSIGHASISTGTYQNRKIRAQEKWDNVRQATFAVACSLEAPSDSVGFCSACSTQIEELIRCRDCGAFAVYCRDCERNVHSHVLHKPEIWNVCVNYIL